MVSAFHFFGHGAQVLLEIDNRLGWSDQLVNLPAQEESELDDLVGFRGTVALLDGDISGAAALQEGGHFFLRFATCLARLGDPSAQNPGIRLKRGHGTLLVQLGRGLGRASEAPKFNATAFGDDRLSLVPIADEINRFVLGHPLAFSRSGADLPGVTVLSPGGFTMSI